MLLGPQARALCCPSRIIRSCRTVYIKLLCALETKLPMPAMAPLFRRLRQVAGLHLLQLFIICKYSCLLCLGLVGRQSAGVRRSIPRKPPDVCCCLVIYIDASSVVYHGRRMAAATERGVCWDGQHPFRAFISCRAMHSLVVCNFCLSPLHSQLVAVCMRTKCDHG